MLKFIDGQEAEDEFTKEIENAVKLVRDNEKWRLEYMTLQMSYQEKFEQGVEQGIIQGAEQEKIEIAIRMLKDGDISYEKIAMYSGLTLEEVLKLR